MTPSELFQHAAVEFGRRVERIKDDQWALPTPDNEWNVRALVHHVVSEDLWVSPLISGQTISEVGSRFDGDILGSDPKAAYRRASSAASSAFAEPDAASRIVHLSFGDVPGRDYAMQMFMDHLIHAWDLARAIKTDEHLDEELVEACYAEMKTQAKSWRAGGAFGPAIEVPDQASAQVKLLALTGRRV
jgi:uncharacterized protein (TIGR03086 family)